MKSVSYAGLNLATADDIADALLQLAAALGVNERAETVEIPVVDGDGAVTRVQLVIGPASQLLSRPVVSDHPDPVDEAVVQELKHRTTLLGSPRAAAVTRADADRFDFDVPL